MATVIVGLLGGYGGVVAEDGALSEDGAEAPLPAYVTGTARGTPRLSGRADAILFRVAWSDPRLPARMLFRPAMAQQGGTDADGDFVARRYAASIRLDGPEGAWVGTWQALVWGPDPHSVEAQEAAVTALMVLDGEGAYEGLSATIVSVERDGCARPLYEGYIFDGDPLPFPDPIESSVQ